jgi:hypothetical protein
MRLAAFATAALLAAAAPAAAQWTEYAYPKDAFTVSFPAEPTVETTTYQAVDGRAVPARLYSLTQGSTVLRMTVADLGGTPKEETAAVNHAIRTLTEGGEIKLDIPHRISRIYGRQLSILRPEGGRTLAAVFYAGGRLYLIEGKALPGSADGTADAIRFQQSLTFTDGGTNRTD